IGDTLITKQNNLLVHPNGPLNPLIGYITHKNGYMHNKRFYTPEINTEYKLYIIDSIRYNDRLNYEYIRKPVKDKVYNDIDDVNKYLTQYHTHLIKIFPSSDQSLSIISGVSDGLTSFLLKDKVKPQNMYILAGLFILSEQIDINIRIHNKRLILKSINDKYTYIDQNLYIYEINQTYSKNNLKKWCRDIKYLIEFLKECINNTNIKYVYNIPSTYEEFKTGEFLNTVQFLIQSYIYEFIDTKDKYIEFIKAVYTLLNDQINNETSTAENIKKSKELINKCFIERSVLPVVINHTRIISGLIKKINPIRACPFINKTELPAYTRVKAYDRINDKKINDEDRKYSNCVEASILGIVCCLMYDPETRMYNTDHILDTKWTKPLKKFFRKYSEPTETTNYEMNQDWCNVVADLKNNKILYLKEGTNELDSSLLNILYVISDITGNKQEVLEEIKSIESICNTEQSDIKLSIEKSLTKILTELSNNKDIEVETKKFTVGNREDKKPDIFGGFSLFYNFSGIQSGVSISISLQHTGLDLAGDAFSIEYKKTIKECFIKVQNKYNNPVGYTECIIREYINLELIKITESIGYLTDSIQNINLYSINTGGNNVLKIFLCGRIESIEYKEYIVMYFLLLYIIKPQKDNSLIRMTNNIIGSVPLDDEYTRNRILRGYICNTKAKEYYTKIDKTVWNDFINDNDEFSTLLLYIHGFISNINVIPCLTGIIKTAVSSMNNYDIIMDNVSGIINIISKELDKTDKPKNEVFNQIIEIIKESCKEMDKYKLTNIYLSIFLKLTSGVIRGFYKNSFFYEYGLMYLFNIIDNEYLIVENKQDIDLSRPFLNKILEYSEDNKKVFYYNPENIEKYHKIIEIINIKSDIVLLLTCSRGGTVAARIT
ncbi:hypothetical protein NEIRO03_2238, partial [Nematocida sp. AWRm78]